MTEQNNFTGTVVHVGQTESVGEKGFKKRLLVVSDNHAEYPQEIPFEFTGDNVGKLDNISNGDKVTVGFNLRGRKWQDKWFSSVSGWRIETEVKSEPTPQQTPAAPKPTAQREVPAHVVDDSFDLPF